MAKPIGTLGTINTMLVGGRLFADTANLIVLHGLAGNANRYSTHRKGSGSSGYTITTGKTYTIDVLEIISNTSTAKYTGLSQANNDSGMDSSTTPTGEVAYLGWTLPQSIWITKASQSEPFYAYPKFDIAATKYVTTYHGASAGINTTYGYES